MRKPDYISLEDLDAAAKEADGVQLSSTSHSPPLWSDDDIIEMRGALIECETFLEAWHFDEGDQGKEIQAGADRALAAVKAALYRIR